MAYRGIASVFVRIGGTLVYEIVKKMIRDILSRMPYRRLRQRPDIRIARQFNPKLIASGWLAR